MYEFLEGKVAARNAAALVLEVRGVGFSILTPLGARMPAPGESLRVYTHLVVREDAHLLYGFREHSDRDLFRLLLKVRGVGPTMALSLLSVLDRTEIVQALVQKEPKTFTRAKGVGRKTAEQIVLDLAERAQDFAAGCEVAPGLLKPAPAPTDGTRVADATSALMSIGYNEKDARARVEAAAAELGDSDLERLVRAAIRR